jgi:hypothetical protein
MVIKIICIAMNKKLINTLTIILLMIANTVEVSSQGWKEATANDNRAFIVVTGMRINEDPANYGKDLSFAEGAKVTLTGRNGKKWEKKTQLFTRLGQGGGEAFFTADFPVILDSTYTISMTFKSGTIIQIDGFCMPAEWKTHFYFHSTIGTVSPASVLRKKEDKQANLWCYVYGIFPFDNYKKVGGTQIK